MFQEGHTDFDPQGQGKQEGKVRGPSWRHCIATEGSRPTSTMVRSAAVNGGPRMVLRTERTLWMASHERRSHGDPPMQDSGMARKILFLEWLPEIGGAEQVTIDLLSSMERMRYTPVAAFLVNEGQFVQEVRALAPTYHFALDRWRNLPRLLFVVRELMSLVQREHVSMIQTNHAKAHIVAWLAGIMTRTPTVYCVCENIDPRPTLHRLALSMRPSAYIVPSQWTAKHLRSIGVHPERVVVAYPGTKGLDSDPTWDDIAKLRSDLQVPVNAPLVTMPGRLLRLKGQDVFLRATRIVLEQIPGANFLILGGTLFGLEQDYPRTLEILVEELGLGKRVRFIGHRRDVAAVLAASDVVVHASIIPEAFGIVVIEGMAAGRPVIASDLGGPQEIVIDGRTGYLVPPGDHRTMADRIVRLLKDDELRKTMGSAGRERVCHWFTKESMTRRYQDIWDHVLARDLRALPREQIGCSADGWTTGEPGTVTT
jgi:glycosyltransferase involved in cell wall biosynthesis